jgi:RNA polymerase sigma-70 factor (ECF subfamily)
MAEQSVRPGDEHVWATFEAEAPPHVDRLFRLAMWFEGSRSEAEDVVQETMLQALQSFHRFQPGTNCRAWLTTILQHVRSNRRRALYRSPLVDDPDDRLAQTMPFEAPVPQQLTDEDMLGALRRIPAQFQEVIVLCDVAELTYKEIAEALAIPIGTVMSRLHRGRAYRGARVSLLVTAADGSARLALPGEVLPHVTSPSHVDDMSVVSFRTSRHMVFFVGDVAQADLVNLADAVAGPLYRALAGA